MKIELEKVNRYLFQRLDKLIQDGALEKKQIILFGLNSSSYVTKDYLEDKGYPIYAFIDNDVKKREEANQAIDMILRNHIHKENYDEFKKKIIYAYKPEELLQEKKEDAAILIASKYYSDMCMQLRKMGYVEKTQIFQTVNFYDLDAVLDIKDLPDNMLEIGNKEVREIQLQLLQKVHEICKENQLRYYMCGGTLLGAVRHKGYIPWDDDIDIAMPLNDYKKFIQIMQSDARYMPLSIYTHADSYYNFFMRFVDKDTLIKMWEYPFLLTSGISIDIFPLFGLPKRADEVNDFYHKIRRLNLEFIRTYIESTEETEEVLLQRKKYMSEIICMMEQYDFDESDKIGYLLSKYKEKEIMPRTIYEKQVSLEFEENYFEAASGYKEYLETLFKNYMELPPEKERYNTHNFKAYQKQ